MSHGRRTSGLSVVELLVSVAILGILLAAGAAMMRSASEAYDTTSDVTLTQERLDAITQIVRYDVRLAGYVGSGTALLGDGDPYTWSASSPTALTVRYNEDRYSEAGSSLAITYTLANGTLTRQVDRTSGTGAADTLLDDVASLSVTEDVSAGGATQGLRITITLLDGTTVPISARFTNAQE